MFSPLRRRFTTITITSTTTATTIPNFISSRRFLAIKTKKFTAGVEWVSICGLHEEDHYLRSLSKKEREKRIKSILEGTSSKTSTNNSSSSVNQEETAKPANSSGENKNKSNNNNKNDPAASPPSNTETTLLHKKLQYENLFHSHHYFVNTSRQTASGHKTASSSSPNETSTTTSSSSSSTSRHVFEEDEDDAPSCPVRRRDHVYQDQLAFALRELHVSDYFIRKMQKRTPLPRIVHHPSDDSSAVFMCRYFLNHRFDEASDAEIIARLKLDCNLISYHQKQQQIQQQHMNMKKKGEEQHQSDNNDNTASTSSSSRTHYHRSQHQHVIHDPIDQQQLYSSISSSFIPKPRRISYYFRKFCTLMEENTSAASFCSLMMRRGYWRLMRRRFVPNWVSSRLVTTTTTTSTLKEENIKTDVSNSNKSNIKQNDNKKKTKEASFSSSKSTEKDFKLYDNNNNNTEDESERDLRFSYFEIDTIESLTHRLTIIVQPERIITVSRYPINFVNEMEAKFEHLYELEPPVDFICDLVTQCSKTFLKAARVELKFVDQLEGIFFEQQSRRERTNSYRTMLYQLHRVSRRASISCSVLPQSIGAFGDLMTAMQQSTMRQQHEQELACDEERKNRQNQTGNNNNRSDTSPASLCNSECEGDMLSPLLTASQIASSNRKVRDTISQMQSALALHADVYESTRSVMALFFQESANELEELTRTLTVFSAVFIPIGFATSVLGVNLEAMDCIYKIHSGFYFAVGFLLICGLGTRTWLSRAVM